MVGQLAKQNEDNPAFRAPLITSRRGAHMKRRPVAHVSCKKCGQCRAGCRRRWPPTSAGRVWPGAQKRRTARSAAQR
eukprot:10437869-Alexandrium_andersonii.AAC.1